MVKIIRYVPLLLLPLPGLIPLACSTEPPIAIDNTCTPPVACSKLEDCYSNGNKELGTECRGNLCLCPDWEGMSQRPCCAKGAPPNVCWRVCSHIDECEPEQCAGSTGASSSGSGGGGGGAGGQGGASGSSSGE
jgi:hypothetical protein